MNDVLLVGWDDVGIADATPDVCPNLAAFKAGGLYLPLAFSNPVCSQSRATILYGASGRRLGITISMNSLDPDAPVPPADWPTLPTMLADAGWATCLVGKFHCGRSPSGAPPAMAPIERGYQAWRAGTFDNVGDYRSWQRLDADDQGWAEVTENVYATSAQVSAAEVWWNATPGPRFLHVALNDPHGPLNGPTNLPPPDLLAGWPAPIPGSTARTRFLAKLRAADTAFGRLLAFAGMEGALVVLYSDNGTAANSVGPGEDPDKAKQTTYDLGIRVPVAVRFPGVAPGLLDQLTHLVDIPASILELVGVARPAEWEGQSTPRTFIISEATIADGTLDQCARTRTWKLRNHAGVEQLFHLPKDPSESHPLSLEDPTVQTVLSFLRAVLYAPPSS